MARTSRIKSSLIFLATGLWCIQLNGVTNHASGFETPPPQPGSIQWQIIQSNAKQRQEFYRKRVAIPGITSGDAPNSNDALFAKRPEMLATQTPLPTASSGSFLKFFLFVVAFCFGGFFTVRKFYPDLLDDLNQRFDLWTPAPVTEWNPVIKVRAEDESFSQFLTAFRVGPSAMTPADLPEITNPIKEFYARAIKHLATQRKLLSEICQEAGDPARRKMLMDFYLEMSALKKEAGFPEVLLVWQVAFALEGLLKQLTEKIRNVTPSTLRAIAGGLDLLEDLCQPGLKLDHLTDRPFKFLVVDDDLIGRQALALALNKAFSQPDIAVDGETALIQAGQHAYDVIFLDVQMPGMDGFEASTKIHETVLNRATPVVFVTVLSDFDARAQSALSGGSDLLAKPFLVFEVTVIALTLALRSRLQGTVQKPLLESERNKIVTNPAVVQNRALYATSPAVKTQPVPARPLDEMTTMFLNRASKNLGSLRELCQTMLQTRDAEARQNILAEAFLRINSLTSKNGSEVIHPAHFMSVTLEGLFRKLLEDSKYSTPSALATVTTAMDLLDELCVPGLKTDLAVNPPVHILVADDDLVARRAIVGALQITFNKPENVESGEGAVALAMEKPFDVIFLDVKMPGMDGFDACAKIRQTVANRDTPVVFVTGLNDFDMRAKMSHNGGNDLMAKPFFAAEIIVKALTFALRGRLQQFKLLQVQPV